MYTDASGRTGFGSVLDVPLEARRVHGSFWSTEEIQQIICVKELKVIKLGLVKHAQPCKDARSSCIKTIWQSWAA